MTKNRKDDVLLDEMLSTPISKILFDWVKQNWILVWLQRLKKIFHVKYRFLLSYNY